MTNLEQIQALIDAGEKAFPNVTIEGSPSYSEHTKALTVWASDGDALACFYGDYMGSEEQDADFFIKSANSRPAISAMLEENKRLREALAYMVDMHEGEPISIHVMQALEGSE